ncbi:MAG: hypothetical protein FWD73_13280 [Polyangiaceae bacterium]|nr:hypothetical protein [Polyangiaceae bacterium]
MATACLSAYGGRPTVARAEIIDKATRARFEAELEAALKRRPASETKLAGALRAVASLSPALRNAVANAAQTMVKRGSYSREIYNASIRTLAEANDRRVPALLIAALSSHDAGGYATLSAASLCKDSSLAAPLAKLAASKKAHVSFGAETARVCRGESNGAHLASLAPMIKESHRIALCVELFVPLLRSAPVPIQISPALSVLRGAERHLGRWLVLAEVATRAGELSALEEASSRAEQGPSSARSAWMLVAWTLARARAAVAAAVSMRASTLPREANLDALVTAPSARPTAELVARLSDRPSADRDTTFLFRLANARVASCKPMLETLAKTGLLTDEISLRAALYLARDYGRSDMKDALVDSAQHTKRDELRGFAVAALWDTGDANARKIARDMSDELLTSRCISNVAWGALVRAASTTDRLSCDTTNSIVGPMVAAETALRWVQWGWLE